LTRRLVGRVFEALVLAFILGSIAAGLLGILVPAGRLVAAGEAPRLLAWPGLWPAAMLSLWSGLAATALALLAALAIAAIVAHSRLARHLDRATPLLIAMPHLAVAIGLAFLLAPSGWLVRLVSPWLTGFEHPPLVMRGLDPLALDLVLGLALKETPFLLLAIAAARQRVDEAPAIRLARSLGCAPAEAWAKVIAPQVVRRIRLPVLAVLVYGLTNVEMAGVLGPTTPSTLALLVLDLYRDADLAKRELAAGGAVLLMLVVAVAILLWLAAARLVGRVLAGWRRRGPGGPAQAIVATGGRVAAGVTAGLSALTLVVLALWSLAGPWRFPDALPARFRLEVWTDQAGLLLELGLTTLVLAAGAALIAVLLVVLWLECRPNSAGFAWLLAPLLLPQLGFLMGLEALTLRLGVAATAVSLLWMHLVFVLAYVALLLRDPWRTLDPRYERTARSLGHGPLSVLMRVKLPLLKAPILTAFAVGFAVSVALYLPTLFGGGGRYATLALEALALAQGGDRRLTAVLGLLLALLPLLVFAAARLLARERRPA